MFQRILFIFLIVFAAQWSVAQNLTGTVTDPETGDGVYNAAVVLVGTGLVTQTDINGDFILKNINCAGKKCILRISMDGFTPVEMPIESRLSYEPLAISMSKIPVSPVVVEQQKTADIPTVTLEETETDDEGASEIANVLNASQDVFQRIASFGFSTFRFRDRGYEGRQSLTFVNGMPFNDLETGFTAFGEFGGLNDVLRNRSSTVGLDPAEFTFGQLGGATFIDTRASSQRKQLRVSHAVSNRTYRHRTMATFSSGLVPGGWALTVSGSHRWADEGYVPGTFMDAWSYFLSLDKKLNSKHALNLTFFGSPMRRGATADSFQEMFDLAGSNYYNPNWGYWNGKKRNGAVIDNHQPTAILRYDWVPSAKTNLMVSAFGQTGKNDRTRGFFVNARNPAADFNRRLPSSFLSPEMAELQAELLRTDENYRQINWAEIYQTNLFNVETILDADGIQDNTVTGRNSKVIVSNERSLNTDAGINLVLNHSFSSRLTFNGGAMYQYYKGENFREVDDLLGGEFFLDRDFFTNFEPTRNSLAGNSDIRTPNNIVRVGDRFSYDYDEHIRRTTVWGQAQYLLPRWQFFAGFEGLSSQMWREGNMQNGRFPNNSLGKSETISFNTYNVKAGGTFKINGRNYLYVNGMYGTRPPQIRSVYYQPRTRDFVAPNIEASSTQAIEGGYLLRSPNYKARVTGFFTEFKNDMENIFASAWSIGRVLAETDLTALGIGDEDIALEQPIFFGGAIAQNINRRHVGVEAAIEAKLTPSWIVSAATSVGQYIYTNRPDLSISLDNGSAAVPVLPLGKMYLENFYVPRTPQTVASLGLKYEGRKFWFASLTGNYAANSWYSFDPVRRTEQFVAGLSPQSPIWNTIIDQQRAPAAFTLDFFGGKSIKIRNYFIYFNLGVNNILNNQEIVISGREVYRNAFRREVQNPLFYTNELLYAFGTNYFASIALRL